MHLDEKLKEMKCFRWTNNQGIISDVIILRILFSSSKFKHSCSFA